MTNSTPVKTRLNGRFAFFQEFLKHPLQIGSIIPSSHFLEQRILEAAQVASANTIVELGSGTGGTTQAILHAMPQHAKLLSIEINPNFHNMVKRINDNRLIAHLGSAAQLKETLSLYGLSAPDAVISGIPFSTMNSEDGSSIIASIAATLAPYGRFVAYQVSKRVAYLSRPILGSERVVTELRNIPPMRVYQWEKTVPDMAIQVSGE